MKHQRQQIKILKRERIGRRNQHCLAMIYVNIGVLWALPYRACGSRNSFLSLMPLQNPHQSSNLEANAHQAWGTTSSSDPSSSPLLLPWGTWLSDRGRYQRRYKVTPGYCLPAWPAPGQSVSCPHRSYKWQNQLVEHQLMEQTVFLHTERKSLAATVKCSQLITKVTLYRWDLLSCCQGPVSPL